MDGLVRAQVEAIHGSGARLALCVTGGGTRAVSWLVGVAGASRSILEVQIPYSASALEEYLGERVESAVAPRLRWRWPGRRDCGRNGWAVAARQSPASDARRV